MSGLDGARLEAIASRKKGYVLIAITILAATLTTLYDVWPVWGVLMGAAGFMLGRSQGLAEARGLMRPGNHRGVH